MSNSWRSIRARSYRKFLGRQALIVGIGHIRRPGPRPALQQSPDRPGSRRSTFRRAETRPGQPRAHLRRTRLARASRRAEPDPVEGVAATAPAWAPPAPVGGRLGTDDPGYVAERHRFSRHRLRLQLDPLQLARQTGATPARPASPGAPGGVPSRREQASILQEIDRRCPPSVPRRKEPLIQQPHLFRLTSQAHPR